MKKLFVIITLCMQVCMAFSQEGAGKQSPVTFNLNADLVNRYLWRGLLYSPNVNIQPYAGISYAGLSLSTWASYGLSDKYAEVDFTLSYNISNLTISINDYFNEREDSLMLNKHFNLKNKTTKHALEASVSFKISDNLPISLTAATFFYGNDRKPDGKNYYSTYFEIAYPVTFQEYSFNFFVGGTPKEGLYADKAAIVNTGLTATKNLKVSESFSIPMSASLVSNPKAEDIFLILKLTF